MAQRVAPCEVSVLGACAGATLGLAGDTFAPRGEGRACVFATPGRLVGNDTVNESAIVATFISPTRLAMQADAARR